jgi:hypothetical protein
LTFGIFLLLHRDTAKIVRELDNALAFNEKLGAIASQADAGDLVPSIGPISVLGEPILHGLSFAKFIQKYWGCGYELSLHASSHVIELCAFANFLLKVYAIVLQVDNLNPIGRWMTSNNYTAYT